MRYMKTGYDHAAMEQFEPLNGYFSEALNPNASDVFAAIHVSDSTKSPKFDIHNVDVMSSLADTGMLDITTGLEELLNTTECDGTGGRRVSCSIGVFVYAGEFDSVNGA